MNTNKIGIAGYMGSGKTTCAKILAEAGYHIIDADSIAKETIGKNVDIRLLIAEEFGSDILAGPTIDYSALGKRAFYSLGSLQRLNSIVHPKIIDSLEDIIKFYSDKKLVLDASLISYWRIERWFDTLCWIDSPFKVRLKRLEKSLSIAGDDIRKRMLIQEELFSRPEELEWTIINNIGTVEELKTEILQIGVISRGS